MDPLLSVYPAYVEAAVAVLATAVDWWSSVDPKLQVSFGSFSRLSESLSVSRLASSADIRNTRFTISNSEERKGNRGEDRTTTTHQGSNSIGFLTFRAI